MHGYAHMPPTNSVLSFAHLSYEVTLKGGAVKKLLDDVSIEVKAGELLAIMVRPCKAILFTVSSKLKPRSP